MKRWEIGLTVGLVLLVSLAIFLGIYFGLKKKETGPAGTIISQPSGEETGPAGTIISQPSGEEIGPAGTIISEPSGEETRDYVEFSNSIRNKCSPNIGNLKFSSTMEKEAQDYADKMKNCGCMSHYLYDGCGGCNSASNNTSYEQANPSGQNLYRRVISKKLSDEELYKDAINSWAGEGFNGNSTNHYTAMNWASATTIGCAISSDTGTYQNNPVNYYYVACQYGAPTELELPNVNPTPSNLNSQVLCTESLEV